MSTEATPANVGSMEGLGLAERLRDLSRRGYWPLIGDEAADELERLRAQYNELIYAVGNKHPGETRHQTALRYIQRAEAPNYPFGGQGGGLTQCDMHDDESY